MRRVYKNLCPAKISASIMAVNMWKNSLKNVESDNNTILYETLLNFFLQRNSTYFLNKRCTVFFIEDIPQRRSWVQKHKFCSNHLWQGHTARIC